MDGWNTTFLLWRPIFRCHISLREGRFLVGRPPKPPQISRVRDPSVGDPESGFHPCDGKRCGAGFFGGTKRGGVETKNGSNVPKIILDPSNGSVLRRI